MYVSHLDSKQTKISKEDHKRQLSKSDMMTESPIIFKINDSSKSDKKQSSNISRLKNELNLMQESNNLLELYLHIQNVRRCISELNVSVILQNYKRSRCFLRRQPFKSDIMAKLPEPLEIDDTFKSDEKSLPRRKCHALTPIETFLLGFSMFGIFAAFSLIEYSLHFYNRAVLFYNLVYIISISIFLFPFFFVAIKLYGVIYKRHVLFCSTWINNYFCKLGCLSKLKQYLYSLSPEYIC